MKVQHQNKEKTITPQPNHKQIDEEGQAQHQEMVKERLQMAIKLTLIQVLEEEIEACIGYAPYVITRFQHTINERVDKCSNRKPAHFQLPFSGFYYD